MLSSELYTIGNKYNKITKYNVGYDRRPILDWVCSAHIMELLEEKYPLTNSQKNKLNAILNNLIVL